MYGIDWLTGCKFHRSEPCERKSCLVSLPRRVSEVFGPEIISRRNTKRTRRARREHRSTANVVLCPRQRQQRLPYLCTLPTTDRRPPARCTKDRAAAAAMRAARKRDGGLAAVGRQASELQEHGSSPAPAAVWSPWHWARNACDSRWRYWKARESSARRAFWDVVSGGREGM